MHRPSLFFCGKLAFDALITGRNSSKRIELFLEYKGGYMLEPIIIKDVNTAIDPSDVRRMCEELMDSGIILTETVVQLLMQRGIQTVEEVEAFVEPGLEKMYDPYLLKDMDKAVKLITKHIDNQTSIVIYGDYDVDGITSTTILYKALSYLTDHVSYYIPNRLEEGYGINTGALERLHVDRDAALIISVDTGITAVEEVEFAHSLSMDIIITDHHECQENVPTANAVINPKQSDCSYPCDFLAGVGVTYKLIQGLSHVHHFQENFVLELLEIVAIGTIADIVPLLDENRVFVANAFRLMKELRQVGRGNLGLSALMEVSGVDIQKISGGTVGFQIGPRLNAAGRLGDAEQGVRLFMTTDYNAAMDMAEHLNQVNQERQIMERTIFEEADRLIQEQMDVESTKIIVLAHEGWHHGVIGIVASRITEKYYRPTVLLAIEDGVASGSARSVEGFSIFQALMSVKPLLDKFGGHEMAAGMSLDASKVSELRNGLNQYAQAYMDKETLIPKIGIDMPIEVPSVTIEFIESLSLLEPYGMGNPEPRFLLEGDVRYMSLMGKEQNHFKMQLHDEQSNHDIDVVAFYGAHYKEALVDDIRVRLIGTFNVNEWKGFKKPQVFIKAMLYESMYEVFLDKMDACITHESTSDLQVNSLREKEVMNLLKTYVQKPISREFCVEVYKGLRKWDKADYHVIDSIKLEHLVNETVMSLSIATQVFFSLMVFCELGLITIRRLSRGSITFHMNQGKKVELLNSTLYNNMCLEYGI